MELAAKIADAALREIGRDDLADICLWFLNDDDSIYIEPCDDLNGDDLVLVERAEALALTAIQRSDREHSAARVSGGESSPATSHPIPTVPPSVASGGPAGGTAAAQPSCDQSSRHPDATDERNTTQ